MNASELAAILPQGSLFSACRADELADLLALSTRHDMKKGQTLLLQGDPGDQVLILLSGNAKVTMVAMNGREKTPQCNLRGVTNNRLSGHTDTR